MRVLPCSPGRLRARWSRGAHLLPLLVFAVGTGPAVAQESEVIPVVTLTELTVENGHPVGHNQGTIFKQSYSPSCTILPGRTLPIEAPVVGTVGDTLQLQGKSERCPEGAAAVPMCEWQIRNTDLSGRSDDNGLMQVLVPQTTGIYSIAFRCTVRGDGKALDRTVSVTRPLYATYSAPLDLVSLPGQPPAADWYRLASLWGAGFESGSHESEVLRSMMARLFEYGSTHWRYGSFDVKSSNDDSSDSSDDGSTDDGSSDDESSGSSGDSSRSSQRDSVFYDPVCVADDWCYCPWQQLAAHKGSCNFGSCYQFSDTLMYIAATFGIGGLTEVTIEGSSDQGFATLPAVPSLDPQFPFNIVCDDPANCPPYLFSSHRFLERDGVFYDPTFNRIYENQEQPVYRNVLSIKNGKYQLSESPLSPVTDGPPTSACLLGIGYGSWYYYSHQVQIGVDCQKALPQGTDPAIELAQEAQFETVTEPGKSTAKALMVSVTTEVKEVGDYTVHGVLLKDGNPIAERPIWETEQFTRVSLPESEGSHTVKLPFSGEEIYRTGEDGPYQVDIIVTGGDTVQSRTTYTTPALSYQDFGELPGSVRGARVLQIRPGPRNTSLLQVEIDVNVRNSGLFAIHSRLSKDGETLCHRSQVLPLRVGDRSKRQRVPCSQEVQQDGSQTLVVSLHKVPLQPLGSFRLTL